MTGDSRETDELLRQAARGDRQALADLFEHYRPRLRRMISLRMDRRLLGRVDPSDILQETFLDVTQRAPEHFRERKMPFFLWLRSMTGRRLLNTHRQHLGTQMRDAGREVSLYKGASPVATSFCLASQLLGRLTSVSQKAMRAEMQIQLQEALNTMDALDREVLCLRHFEELSNQETAQALGLDKSAASKRYTRAMIRLHDILSSIPGLLDS